MCIKRFPKPLRGHQLAGFVLAAAGLVGLVVCLCEVPSRSAAQEKVPGAGQTPGDEREARRIRRLLNASNYSKYIGQLESLGAGANGVYLSILEDKNANSLEVTRIIGQVSRQEGDRGEFLPHVLRLLSHKEDAVRWCAAHLMGKIGGPEHAANLVPLLTDESNTVQGYAAEALANIGTAKELEALDRRLATKLKGEYEETLADLRESRVRLKQRLEREKKKK